MTTEMQDRIASIRRGELSDGFKKVGRQLAPREWKEFRLGDLYTERNEPGHDGLPILTVSIHDGVSDGALDDDELGKTVKRMEDKSAYKKAVAGDIVFNMMRAWQGAIGTVRSTGMVSPAYIVASPAESLDPLFMHYYMRSPSMIYTMHSQSYGVTDFRLRLYWDSFAPIQCALPDKSEQKRIAEILSAQDHLIELKEKRFEEKKRQKKYLMQQLLTGKKRLPGFSGKWERYKLKELSHYRTTHLRTSNMIYIGTENILPHFQNLITDVSPRSTAEGLFFKAGDILISNIRPYLQKIWIAKQNGICSPDVLVIAPDCLNSETVFYFLANDASFAYISSGARGSKMPRGDKRHIMDMKLSIPPTPSERKAIIAILSTADHEISLLKQSIDSEKQKKEALMQLLLTGIIRVNRNALLKVTCASI